MGNTLNNKKANGLALLPFLVFIVVYMGAGLVYQSKGVDMAFYQFPSVTAMFLAVLVARNWTGTRLRPRLTVASRPPISAATVANAPARM